MDESINRLASQLARSSAEAMSLLKRTLWHGTEHWDKLLLERAGLSGKLVLDTFARSAIQQLRKR